jgi:hypothetical protein
MKDSKIIHTEKVSMYEYIGVKLIKATPMTRGEFAMHKYHKEVNEGLPSDMGYLVKYTDDYESWSPKEHFDEAYQMTYPDDFEFNINRDRPYSDFQLRAIDEFDELFKKLTGLTRAVVSDKFDTLPEKVQLRLGKQLRAMTVYRDVLYDGICDFVVGEENTFTEKKETVNEEKEEIPEKEYKKLSDVMTRMGYESHFNLKKTDLKSWTGFLVVNGVGTDLTKLFNIIDGCEQLHIIRFSLQDGIYDEINFDFITCDNALLSDLSTEINLKCRTILSDVSPKNDLSKSGKNMNFGQALHYLKEGEKVARVGWNGNGMHCFGRFPDSNSKMTHPYFVITIPGCEEGTRMLPWQPAQVDLFAEDWEIVNV